MILFERLREVVLIAQREDDLPDYLAMRFLEVVENRVLYQKLTDDVSKLIEQVELYDNYGQTGYIGMGVDSNILERSLNRLQQKAGLNQQPES